jgi:hypothetical protein
MRLCFGPTGGFGVAAAPSMKNFQRDNMLLYIPTAGYGQKQTFGIFSQMSINPEDKWNADELIFIIDY